MQFAKQIDHAPKLVVLKQILEDCGIGLGGGVGDIGQEGGGSELQSGGAGSGHRVLVFAQLKGLLVRGQVPTLLYSRSGTVRTFPLLASGAALRQLRAPYQSMIIPHSGTPKDNVGMSADYLLLKSPLQAGDSTPPCTSRLRFLAGVRRRRRHGVLPVALVTSS